MILVSGGTATVRSLSPSPYLGHLHTPANGNRIDGYWLPWACDNGAFLGLDVSAFLKMLSLVSAAKQKPMWVTSPDVVGDSVETLRRFSIWGPLIRELGLAVAFVMQDGCERLGIPWDDLDAVFVGGTTGYKLSREAVETVREAQSRGKWTHMGRVNGFKRVRYAKNLGIDSIDGTQWSRFGETYLPKALRVLAAEPPRQKCLFMECGP